MPDWMEPYREMINNTGGNSVEALMNNHSPNLGQTNVILAVLISCVDSQVQLLNTLHREGKL
jgi:hypothetical protein